MTKNVNTVRHCLELLVELRSINYLINLFLLEDDILHIYNKYINILIHTTTEYYMLTLLTTKKSRKLACRGICILGVYGSTSFNTPE